MLYLKKKVILLYPYTELTHINSWLYPNNNLLYYVYLVFQTENAAGVVLLLFYKLLSQAHIASVSQTTIKFKVKYTQTFKSCVPV
jgi:hypothetical protein